MGNGLQGFPREIRKYLSNEFYVDLDIVNCHPVIIENVLRNCGIAIPKFLIEYNTDRSITIKKYKLKDKLDDKKQLTRLEKKRSTKHRSPKIYK